MRSPFLMLLLAGSLSLCAQNPTPATSSNPPKAQTPASSASKPAQEPSAPQPSAANPESVPAPNPRLEPPHSDRVDASALDDQSGESSSKDTQIDLSPPEDDDKAHPRSAEAVMDAEGGADNGDINEFHPWDPHKAAKDIEVGDFYFRRKNYIAAESRYREALYYKKNDATASFKLAVCLEKMGRPDEAVAEFESYLKILPFGPEAPEAKKAIERLKAATTGANPSR